MTKESLIAAGFTEDQATKILELHQKSIDGNYIPKPTFEAEREKVKNLNAQIAERDSQIKTLGEFKGTAEQLQTKVAELEAKNKEDKSKFEEELLKSQMEAEIRLSISHEVIDADDVVPKLDQSKIVFKDGKIVSGLKEQMDELKKSKPHYFKAAEDKNKSLPIGWLFGKTPQEGTENKDSKNEAEEFGSNLAKFKASSEATAAKAAEHYFK